MTALDARVHAAHQHYRTLGHTARRSAAFRQTGVALFDALVIAAVATSAHTARFGFGPNETFGPEGTVWAYYAIPLAWMALLAACGAYSLHHLQTGMVEYQRVALGSGLFAGAIGIICYLASYDLSRGFFVALFAIGIPALLIGRLVRRRTLKRLRTKGLFPTSVLVAGSPSHVDEVARVLVERYGPANGFGWNLNVGAITRQLNQFVHGQISKLFLRANPLACQDTRGLLVHTFKLD